MTIHLSRGARVGQGANGSELRSGGPERHRLFTSALGWPGEAAFAGEERFPMFTLKWVQLNPFFIERHERTCTTEGPYAAEFFSGPSLAFEARTKKNATGSGVNLRSTKIVRDRDAERHPPV